MTITQDWVDGLPEQKLIHKGRPHSPTLLVIHYSVTNTIKQAVDALNTRKLSYHILVGKDGKAVQTRRLNETAAHPGLSNWKAQADVGLGNSVQIGSIGICLMNKGFDPDSNVPTAPGKLIYRPSDPSMQEWESYTAAQLATCNTIAKDILSTYPITDVVGHHDVAIGGKFDPGPLFDLKSLAALATGSKSLGFKTTVRSSDGTLNLRQEAEPNGKVLKVLKQGDVVHIRSIAYAGKKAQCIDPNTPTARARYLNKWASVDIDGSDTHAGFVHMSGLASTPLVPALAAKL